MKLLQSLTDFLTEHGVKNLESWAEDGELIFSPTGGDQGLAIKYTANFEMSNTKTQPIRVFGLVIAWIAKFNQEREDQGLPNPQFFSERLEDQHYDLGIRIEFNEEYMFELDENGSWLANGQPSSLVSTASERIDLDGQGTLEVVDAHTQDTEMKS